MKQSRELDKVQEQMIPDVITHSGLLGSDTRKLGDILEHDNETVKRLGLTHKKIAARMMQLRAQGMKGLGLPVNTEDNLEVSVESARGKLPCPFLHKGLYAKNCTVVKNLDTGNEILFTDLNIHMIEEHGFYEGFGSLYRLDPETLIKELKI